MIGATLLVAVLTACTAPADDAARPVTTEESQVLASMRFHNFDAGTREVSFDIAAAGSDLSFTGWFDFAGHRGYGMLTDGGSAALLAWNPAQIGMQETTATAPALPAPADGDWATAPLDASSSRLHALLAVFTSLGSDRPDNPLLLLQSGALWLGTDELDGAPVTVFAGPPGDEPLGAGDTVDARARYWVDAGGLLLRADIRLGDDAEWTTARFGPADGVDLAGLFAQDAS